MANHFSKTYNLAQSLNRKRIPILPRMIVWINRLTFSCDIPLNPEIDRTVTFSHNGLGTVTHQRTKIGKGTKIQQNVTIGGNMGKKREIDGVLRTAPVIGENVMIGAGASVLGPVIIGDNATVGAGAVVVKDVPAGSVAVGVPAKILEQKVKA